MIWDDQSTYYAKVALAPFSDAVRPGAPYLEQVRGTPASTHRFKDNGHWYDYKLADCVWERGGNGAYIDIAPVGDDLLGPVYTANGTCNPSSEVMPLTSDKDHLKSKIDAMQAKGWAAGHLGTAWVWYLISPNWSDIWPPESEPASYDDADVEKVAILMSDGEYNQQYDAAGVAIRDESRGGGAKNGLSDAQARQICDNIQEAGITVYTIGFNMKEKNAIETMSRCATTTENFYLAETGEQLRQAFRNIAMKLTPLYISQ